MAQWVRSLNLTAHTSLSPIRRGFAPSFVNYKKGCTRLAAASDQVYQLLAQGQWFSLGTPASSSTKTGHHDIAEILLKVTLKHQKISQSIHLFCAWFFYGCILYNYRLLRWYILCDIGWGECIIWDACKMFFSIRYHCCPLFKEVKDISLVLQHAGLPTFTS